MQRRPSATFLSLNAHTDRPAEASVGCFVLPPLHEVPCLVLVLSGARLPRRKVVLGVLCAVRRDRRQVLSRGAEVANVAVSPQVRLQRRDAGRVSLVQLRAVACQLLRHETRHSRCAHTRHTTCARL